MIDPPKELGASRLFLLLAQPSVSWLLDCRIRGAEHIALGVRGLTAQQFAEISFSNKRDLALLRIALTADGRSAFHSDEEVAHLGENEVGLLAEQAYIGLGICSPIVATCNIDAWMTKLKQGARSAICQQVAVSLASCVDITMAGVVSRPDRFFGKPLHALTDGQWLAYHAARDVVEAARAPSGAN